MQLTIRQVLWTPRCTRAAGRGFVRDMGRMTRAEAEKLAFLWGARFVSLA